QGDTILGGAGDDELRGGKGHDSIVGGAGDDTIYSGLGRDTLTGGDGADIFVLRGYDMNFPDAVLAPTITDFEIGSDRLAIQGVTAADIATSLASQEVNDGNLILSIAGSMITLVGVNVLSTDDIGLAADLGV